MFVLKNNMSFFDTFEEFVLSANEKIQDVNIFFRDAALKDMVFVDHLGYKCSSHEEFYHLKKILEDNSAYIYQSIISGRKIAVIRLTYPIKTFCGPIWYIELSDQKADNSFVSAFEHIEIYPIDKNIDNLVKNLQNKKINIEKTEKAHHTTWDFFVKEFKIRIEAEPLIEKIKREEML